MLSYWQWNDCLKFVESMKLSFSMKIIQWFVWRPLKHLFPFLTCCPCTFVWFHTTTQALSWLSLTRYDPASLSLFILYPTYRTSVLTSTAVSWPAATPLPRLNTHHTGSPHSQHHHHHFDINHSLHTHTHTPIHTHTHTQTHTHTHSNTDKVDKHKQPL